ncbi:MAG: antibiotic biosynthesis monooxygenase [bacterium]|nr:antibiotic biosynthesis monooxygenase [bacterium]
MSDLPQPENSSPVRVAVTHRVDLNKREPFEAKLKEVMAIAASYPGFLGTEIVHHDQGQYYEYNVFYRFDTLEHYTAWNDSKIKMGLLDQLHRYTVSSHKTFLTGLETWFSLGSDQAIVPPPKYKMALSTWVGVYLLLVLIFNLLGKPLGALPMMLRFFLVSLVVVLLMTYVVMPLITRLLAKWLYPRD